MPVVSRVWGAPAPGHSIRTRSMDGGTRARASRRPRVEGVYRTVEAAGGFRRAVRPGDTVLLKANFNSAIPAELTDIPFLSRWSGVLATTARAG